jgi:hypothetical protein
MITTTLHLINLSDSVYHCGRNKATLGVPTYEAFTVLLRVNTNLDLRLLHSTSLARTLVFLSVATSCVLRSDHTI